MVSDTIAEPQKPESYSPYIIVAVLVFFIPLITGYFAGPVLGDNPLADMEELFELLGDLSPLVIFLVIFFNNTIKALLAVVLGILAGLPTLVFVGFNGYILGAVVAALKTELSGAVIAASLVPHGIIEISMILLASAFGLAVGMESIRYLFRRKSAVRATLKKGLMLYLKWVLAGLFIAAVVEVLVTPLIAMLVSGGTILSP